ncbi:MAG: putative DNA-binding domain-containing protein [Methylococcaceae bacterium]
MPHNQPSERQLSFKDHQNRFTRYLRDPDNNPLPEGTQQHRMAMYRELFFNNVDSFLTSNFPVLHKILNTQQWQALSKDFFANYRCKTPYFSEIPEEFIKYLESNALPAENYPDFMLELAHYEWVEMAVSIAQAETPIGNRKLADDPSSDLIALSPLAWPLAYQYPVHRLSPEFRPLEPEQQPTFLVVYRQHDDEVKFITITPMTYALLSTLQTNSSLTVDAIINSVAQTTGQSDSPVFRDGAVQIIRQMVASEILYLL